MTSDPRVLIGILRDSHDRLAAVAQPLGPDELRAQSYDRDWTIAQVLSHLGSGAEIGTLNLSAALSGNGRLDRDSFQPIWDAWNNRTPEAQAADALTWDEQHVSRLEQLTDEQLAGIRLDLFGRQLDAAGLVRLRLSEHAVHTWDVAVVSDPAATVLPDAVPEALEQISQLLSFVAKPAGDSFRVRVRTTGPDGDYLLDVGEPVTLSSWADATSRIAPRWTASLSCPPKRCSGCCTGGSTRSTPRATPPRGSTWTGSARCSPASRPSASATTRPARRPGWLPRGRSPRTA